MTSLSLGRLSFSASESGVLVRVGDTEAQPLGPREVASLIRFLSDQSEGDARTGFRVPLRSVHSELSEVKASLVHGGRIHDVHLVDLSLTGMLVRTADLDLPQRARVQARVILDDHLAKLEAEVVRREGAMTALHFPNSVSHNGDLAPEEALIDLFRHLERIYLKTRSG